MSEKIKKQRCAKVGELLEALRDLCRGFGWETMATKVADNSVGMMMTKPMGATEWCYCVTARAACGECGPVMLISEFAVLEHTEPFARCEMPDIETHLEKFEHVLTIGDKAFKAGLAMRESK